MTNVARLARKPWFLSFGCDAEVDVVAQPVVGVFIPVFEIGAAVLSGFDAKGVDVVEFVPLDAAGGGGYAVVAEAGEDAAAFGEGPDRVVFEACGDAEGVKEPDAAREGEFHVCG